ncbi:MAG: EF-hand domain-containing protein [Methyloligellaceae bacterium]
MDHELQRSLKVAVLKKHRGLDLLQDRLRVLDHDKGGRISFNEFCQFVLSCKPGTG